jgi:hypothetical protein
MAEMPLRTVGMTVAVSLAMTSKSHRPDACDPPLAIYANYCEVGHNAFEFLIDFGQFRPEAEMVRVHSRIVAGPVVAKLFARLLAEAVGRFEEAHGVIVELADDDPLGALIASQPDFESRADRARRRPITPPGSTAPPNPQQR